MYSTSEQTVKLLETFIEVETLDSDSFLKVRETLTRIGMAAKDNFLWQSCHVFHKAGKYYIVHYKELLQVDGKETNFSEEDLARRNTIAGLLQTWGLVNIIDKSKIASPIIGDKRSIKIVPYKEKHLWKFGAKYTIGK